MRKNDSICSSDRPLVSGTQQPVNSRFTKQMAAKKKKGTWRPKAFWGCGWGGHSGTGTLPPQHFCPGPVPLTPLPWEPRHFPGPHCLQLGALEPAPAAL